LEAKNRELERKLKEETVLREKAEARCMELRKKLRTLSNDPSPTTQEQAAGGESTRKNSVGPNGVASNEANQGVSANGTGVKGGLNNLPAKSPLNGTAKPNGEKGTTGNKPPAKESTNGAATKAPAKAQSIGIAKVQPPSSAGKAQSIGTATKTKVGDQPIATKSVPAGNENLAANPAGSKSVPSPTKATPGPNQLGTIQSDAASSRIESQSKLVRSSSIESVPKEASRARTAPDSRGTSLSDFDPLFPNATSNMEGDVVPFISFPTNVSLGAVPIGSTTSYFQHSDGQAYSPTGAQVPEQFDQFVVPITTFGMAASDAGGTQQHITSGFQMQQPFMLQQPIMFQQVQGGWAAPFTQQQVPVNSQQFYQQHGYAQQQQHQPQYQQQQPQQQQQQLPPSNQFDPFREMT
jgi:hypothetical protein